MSDKQCRFSHVSIIENTPARVLIHWRTALPNVKHETTHADPQTGWEPWGDDYHYISGTRVRGCSNMCAISMA
jgi:hypothetical protein